MTSLLSRKKSHLLNLLLVSACVIAILDASQLANAATNWTGGVDQDWNKPGNWDNGVPAPTQGAEGNAMINNGAPGVYPIISAPGLYKADVDLWIGHTAGTGRLDQQTGTLETGDGNWMFTGQGGGNGTYNLANTAVGGGTFTGYGLGDGSLNVGGALQNGIWHIGIDGSTGLSTSIPKAPWRPTTSRPATPVWEVTPRSISTAVRLMPTRSGSAATTGVATSLAATIST